MILVRWLADGKVFRCQILKSLATCGEAFFLIIFYPSQMILVRWLADGKVCRCQILKSLATCGEAFFDHIFQVWSFKYLIQSSFS
jgi:hypothetical protein